jgi:hypothetical protein
MTKSSSLTGKFLATLFALVFALGFTVGGIVAGVLPMYQQLSGWWKASSYVPVTATVLSAELKTYSGKTPTYQVLAQFGYEYQGRNYVSSRINLAGGRSDNVGSYQKDMFQRLLAARNSAAPVSVWVNPQQPEQAVYDRSLRWLMIVFLLPFAVLFPAVGLGAWWGIWRMWTHREPQFPNEFAPGNGHAPPGPLLC